MTKITAFHERELRFKAQKSEGIKYLNVQMAGLRGMNHPCLYYTITTNEVRKLRPYLKFLSGDFLTYPKSLKIQTEEPLLAKFVMRTVSQFPIF